MRNPPATPQMLHEALSEYLNAIDLSRERIAPFAGLRPQALYRLGKDGRHWTLPPPKLDRLIEAAKRLGKPLPPEQQRAWEIHIKTASQYTMQVRTFLRRSKGKWPKTKEDHERIWNSVSEFRIKVDKVDPPYIM